MVASPAAPGRGPAVSIQPDAIDPQPDAPRFPSARRAGIVIAMPTFMYRCPHCAAENSVTLEQLGQAAACAACDLPFTANAPAAALLQRDGEQWVPAHAQGAAAGRSTGTGQPADARHDDEQTLLVVNPAVFREHPVQSVLLALLCIGGLTMAVQFGAGDDGNLGTTALAVLGLVLGVGGAAVLVTRFVGSRFESLTVTTQRSIWIRGIINRRSSEVQHDDIRNIQVGQSLIERLVGAGTLAISSAGQDDMEITIKGIAHPRDVLETIRKSQSRMVRGD